MDAKVYLGFTPSGRASMLSCSCGRPMFILGDNRVFHSDVEFVAYVEKVIAHKTKCMEAKDCSRYRKKQHKEGIEYYQKVLSNLDEIMKDEGMVAF